MTPTSKRVGARARLGVMMISLKLDIRIRKKGKRTKKGKVLISFRGGMMISLGFLIDTNISVTKYSSCEYFV
jgi:hypothetical protein